MDERYCKWMDTGYYFDLEFGLMNKTETEETTNNNLIPNGVCVPKYSPGFDTESDDPLENGGMCAAANSVCIVTYEINALALKAKKVKSISELPLEERKTYCTHNCHCLEPDWQIKMNSMCSAIGDCGTKNNLISRPGEQSEVVVITAAPVEEAA